MCAANNSNSELPTAFPAEVDSFAKALISRKVWQLIRHHNYVIRDRDDLTQAFLARVVKSLERFDPEVGHLCPFILAVIDRYFLNLVRNQKCERSHESLNVNTRIDGNEPVELIQTLDTADSDRRLARESRLSEEDLNALRMDLEEIIASFPVRMQEFFERRKTQSTSEISREMKIPKSTLQEWLFEIKNRCEKAGLENYFSK
jgi:RNA polymerase sigma factor (sigma-70 family)